MNWAIDDVRRQYRKEFDRQLRREIRRLFQPPGPLWSPLEGLGSFLRISADEYRQVNKLAQEAFGAKEASNPVQVESPKGQDAKDGGAGVNNGGGVPSEGPGNAPQHPGTGEEVEYEQCAFCREWYPGEYCRHAAE